MGISVDTEKCVRDGCCAAVCPVGIIYIGEPAKEIKPIKLIKGGKVRAQQSLRYTTYERLKSAKNLDEVFA